MANLEAALQTEKRHVTVAQEKQAEVAPFIVETVCFALWLCVGALLCIVCGVLWDGSRCRRAGGLTIVFVP